MHSEMYIHVCRIFLWEVGEGFFKFHYTRVCSFRKIMASELVQKNYFIEEKLSSRSRY